MGRVSSERDSCSAKSQCEQNKDFTRPIMRKINEMAKKWAMEKESKQKIQKYIKEKNLGERSTNNMRLCAGYYILFAFILPLQISQGAEDPDFDSIAKLWAKAAQLFVNQVRKVIKIYKNAGEKINCLPENIPSDIDKKIEEILSCQNMYHFMYLKKQINKTELVKENTECFREPVRSMKTVLSNLGEEMKSCTGTRNKNNSVNTRAESPEVNGKKESK